MQSPSVKKVTHVFVKSIHVLVKSYTRFCCMLLIKNHKNKTLVKLGLLKMNLKNLNVFQKNSHFSHEKQNCDSLSLTNRHAKLKFDLSEKGYSVVSIFHVFSTFQEPTLSKSTLSFVPLETRELLEPFRGSFETQVKKSGALMNFRNEIFCFVV